MKRLRLWVAALGVACFACEGPIEEAPPVAGDPLPADLEQTHQALAPFSCIGGPQENCFDGSTLYAAGYYPAGNGRWKVETWSHAYDYISGRYEPSAVLVRLTYQAAPTFADGWSNFCRSVSQFIGGVHAQADQGANAEFVPCEQAGWSLSIAAIRGITPAYTTGTLNNGCQLYQADNTFSQPAATFQQTVRVTQNGVFWGEFNVGNRSGIQGRTTWWDYQTCPPRDSEGEIIQ